MLHLQVYVCRNLPELVSEDFCSNVDLSQYQWIHFEVLFVFWSGNGLGMDWEWTGNGLGMGWEWAGNDWEWAGNGLGMDWEWAGNELGMGWE